MSRTSDTRRIAFQGEPGAFSELAARHYLGTLRGWQTLPRRSFDEVFAAVKSRTARLGIVPIENSLFGSIHQNYDLLRRYPLAIAGEIVLRIRHALLANPGVALKDVKVIYSHPQALGQCERFLRGLKRVEAAEAYDTAGAARMIRDTGRTDAAAIAGRGAARVYGLRVLRSGIETDPRNFTRFIVLSPDGTATVRRQAKTSVMFAMKNIPGALFKALSVFALRDLNLYKIESRPLIGRPWEYLFYLDFSGSVHDRAAAHALEHLREITTFLKILGSYPRGRTIQTP